MNAHLHSKNPSGRAWLKWLSDQVKDSKVTECLKNRVVTIRAEGNPESFKVILEVSGEYARKILQMKHSSLFTALKDGYFDQSGVAAVELEVRRV
jgi:hypothetical protein